MPDPSFDAPQILYLQLSQYPILARRIRERMREELYRRGVINAQQLELEARNKAVLSQHREGLTDPYAQEDAQAWELRLQQIRDHLTDFYFAINLPLELFHRIVEALLAERSGQEGKAGPWDEVALTFNPELAPLDLLLRKVEQYEALPETAQAEVRHHLEEIRVVLIKTIISDQLSFVGVAKAWFTAEDFRFILSRRIGGGKIGGKAAGMLLAWKILQGGMTSLAGQVDFPRSYFVGADVFYEYLALNEVEYINQKYKSPEQIRAEYPAILKAYEQGRFPDEAAERLREILSEVGQTPLIVRSSSLLEDNFGAAFAGKYASYFCPNQGALEENLHALKLAIRRIYASVYSPDALIYRRRMGLLDYDERMAILLQEVQGQRYRHAFFPAVAGVAFSQSPILWNPRLRREEGFVRLVLGLGTRAVDRVGEDYPRLVFLSHPQLRPEVTAEAIQHYSQRLVDVVDLKTNMFATRPIQQVLDVNFPALRWVASVIEDGAVLPLRSLGPHLASSKLVLTFDMLLQRSDFVSLLKQVLTTLTQNYNAQVEIEFALSLTPDARSAKPDLRLHLLQCRPQSTHTAPGETGLPSIPMNLPDPDKLFSTTRMAPQGRVAGVDYILYVPPEAYDRLAEPAQRQRVARTVGLLNKALEGRSFILIGPGRWGSANIELGVPVTYADIYNARALVEVAVGRDGAAPDPSYGTHFFQDLIESNIYPLAVYPDQGDFLNRSFLESAQNVLADVAPAAGSQDCLKLIHVPAERADHQLEILMDGERALAFFTPAKGN